MPEVSLPSTLDPLDIEDFSRLTEQESSSVEGQIAKMDMIREMIRTRYHIDEERARSRLSSTYTNPSDLDAAIAEECQPIRMFSMPLGDGRSNLIVGKGDADDSDENMTTDVFRVMVLAHIDTVESKAPLELTRDPGGSRLRGRGVFDMGAAVLNSIVLAAHAQIPKGVQAYFVFVPDEEMNSRGIRKLIQEWHVFRHLNAVFSSEIGPVDPVLAAGDSRLSLIRARAGRVKMACNIVVDSDAGHGARRHKANATTAKRLMQNRLYDRFYNGHGNEEKEAHRHPIYDVEDFIEEGEDDSHQSLHGYAAPDSAQFEFNVKLIPHLATPSSTVESRVAALVEKFKRWSRGVAKADRWPEYHINHSLVQRDTEASYSPFEIPVHHPQVALLSRAIRQVTGQEPIDHFGHSVADECDVAEAMLRQHNVPSFTDELPAVLTVPVRGDGAHACDECVDEGSILQAREVLRFLLEDPAGYLSLSEAQKGQII